MTCSTPLFCNFVKKNLCLFKIAIQGVSLWHFYEYMYYNPNWFIFSIFSPFYLNALLMVISIDLKILHSFLYRKYTNHIHFLNFLLLPSLSHMWPSLRVTIFHNIACICIRSIFPYSGFLKNNGILSKFLSSTLILDYSWAENRTQRKNFSSAFWKYWSIIFQILCYCQEIQTNSIMTWGWNLLTLTSIWLSHFFWESLIPITYIGISF
jgi:hypothetical protein